MNSRLNTACAFFLIVPSLVVGQTSKIDLKAEEAAIRSILTSANPLPRTDDRVSWAGPTKRPFVGNERAILYPGSDVGKRKNSKRIDTIERLEVAASGEMAWVWMSAKNEYDVDATPATHVKFENSTLMVLKKQGGAWKVAASFARPLDMAFAPNTGTLVGTWKLNSERSKLPQRGPDTFSVALTPDNVMSWEAQFKGTTAKGVCDGRPETQATIRCDTVSERVLRSQMTYRSGAKVEKTEEVSAAGDTLFATSKIVSTDGKVSYLTEVYDRLK